VGLLFVVAQVFVAPNAARQAAVDDMTRSRTTLAVLVAMGGGVVLLLGARFIPGSPTPAPLQVTILGRTNTLSSGPMVLVSVTNQSGCGQGFYFCAEVGTPTGWTDRAGWVEKYQRGMMQWLKPHQVCQVALPVPEGAARYRYSCSSMPDVGAVQWAWFRFVRRFGLDRFGLPVQPRSGLCWTPQLSDETAGSKNENEVPY